MELQGQIIKRNKVFTYMIIHDVKHPTTSLIEVFKAMQNDFDLLKQTLQHQILSPAFEI